MRPADPAVLRLSARAYAWLLRAYPAPFRTEFGGEMALVFSDCCSAAWRSGGSRDVGRLLGRTVLDVLVSAPPLWAERLEEGMKGKRIGRGMGLWLVDHALLAVGLALLVLGATAWPLVQALGWAALGLAFFAWVAEADGLALPRPGRVAIRTCGCWETPLAFTVRRRDRVLFFVREDDPEAGWTDTYAVRERPNDAAFEPCFELPLGPRSEWRLRGRTPAATLLFEHHRRVTYVTRRSLERSLASAGV
ncbi:MAG TPA: hypothetical protein VL691_21495 [Vicinamibacteria bacterium]|nr:hypothetical protein [Vicinamibacteria bacterium]